MRSSSFNSSDCPLGINKEFTIPDAPTVSTFVIKELEAKDNKYTPVLEDSNDYLVFDVDGDVVIQLDDSLPKGFGLLAANVGTGSIQVKMLGLNKLRGWHTLTDPDSFISLIKLTAQLWQSSERR